jgi:MYXO-CTERM domain-containing protein
VDGAPALDAGNADGGSDHAAHGAAGGCSCNVASRDATRRPATAASALLVLVLAFRTARRRRR